MSPVKEDPRVGTPSPLLTTGEIAATDNPTVEPKSASFSSVGLSGPAGTTTLASSSTNNDAAGVGAIAASGQGERPKRKRMTADEKARLAASNLIGDSGSDGDKKRRRTVVAKKVRFVGDNVESRKEGNSGFDGTAIQAATGGFEAAQELKAVEEAKGVKNHARTTSTDGDKAESNDATLYPAGTEQPVLGQAKARVWGGQGKARKPSKERREDMSIIDVPTGLSRKDPKVGPYKEKIPYRD